MTTKTFTQQNVLQAQDTKPTMYQVLDKHKTLMYVGVADKEKFRYRLLGHLVVPRIPCAFFKYEKCESLEQALQKAEKIVKEKNPQYNEIYEIDGRIIEKQLQLKPV